MHGERRADTGAVHIPITSATEEGEVPHLLAKGRSVGLFLTFFIGDETYGCNGINKDSMERDIIGAEWVFLSERFR